MALNPFNSTGMVLSGALATSAIDTSAEVLDIEGADISILKEGRGFANVEHVMNPGFEPQNLDTDPEEGEKIVGKIIFAKKIFSIDDCDTEDQKRWWRLYKLPYIYGIIRLFDAAGHKNAAAVAAIIRDAIQHNEPLEVGFSVEGGVIKRGEGSEKNILKRSLVRGVALTIKPCNKSATADLVYDPEAPEGFQVAPQGRYLFKSEDGIYTALNSAGGVMSADLLKTMTAGSYNAAPGTLTGGSALQVEDRNLKLKSTAKAAARDWKKNGKFKDFLKSYLEKNDLTDVSDEFLDNYSDMVEHNTIRLRKKEEVLVALAKSGNLPKTSIVPDTRLTIQGQPVEASGAKTAKFVSGILHLPEGSFPMSLGDDQFVAKLVHPDLDASHNEVMTSLGKLQQLSANGNIPAEVEEHVNNLYKYLPRESVETPEPHEHDTHHFQLLEHALNNTTPEPTQSNLTPYETRHVRVLLGHPAIVHDSRFTAHLFGLDHSKDKASVDVISKALENNDALLAKVEKWYGRNHTAVQHLSAHPVHGQLTDKTGAAALKHRMALGFSDPLAKSNLDSLAKRHADWHVQYGAVPATVLYAKHILPKLLANAAEREAGNVIRKAQNLYVDDFFALTKSDDDFSSFGGYDGPNVPPVEVGNKTPAPIETKVTKPVKVDLQHHDVPGMNERPESKALAHGFDFGQSKQIGDSGITAKESFWGQSPEGKKTYVKRASENGWITNGDHPDWVQNGNFNSARREGIYANMAHGFFGLGHMVPNVSIVKHPETGVEHAIIEHVPGREASSMLSHELSPHVNKANANGEMERAAIMNSIMENHDRHSGNWLVDKKTGKISLIDHNLYGKGVSRPADYAQHIESESIHPETQKWIKSLSPDKLREHLMANNAPKELVDRSVNHLNWFKESIAKRPGEHILNHLEDKDSGKNPDGSDPHGVIHLKD